MEHPQFETFAISKMAQNNHALVCLKINKDVSSDL